VSSEASSEIQKPSETPQVDKSPAKIRTVATGVLCAILFVISIVLTHPDSDHEWDVSALLVVIVMMVAPLTLVVWSVVATETLRSTSLLWVRRVVQGHCAFALLLLPVACGSMKIGTNTYNYWALAALGSVPAAIVDLIFLALIPKASSNFEVLRIFRQGILAIGGGSLVALSVWPFAVIGLVVVGAEIIASGRPYCIEVGSTQPHSGYRAVTALAELNGLKMHAPWSQGNTREYQFGFHAVLLVSRAGVNGNGDGPQTGQWNWSYLEESFIPISEWTAHAMYIPGCQARPHFALQLPIFAPR
jgi:hypothetical protein